ncbi:MAG: hypothetical protein FWG96_02305 [Methanomassiliicoccaceae archaeon]|nr:hypothetical protein [Methanomassiliicoccaceae archaeon]
METISNNPRRMFGKMMMAGGIGILLFAVITLFIPILSNVSWVLFILGGIDLSVGIWFFLSSRTVKV